MKPFYCNQLLTAKVTLFFIETFPFAGSEYQLMFNY